jgi:RNA polymerase sigma factor (sigma-70 family)
MLPAEPDDRAAFAVLFEQHHRAILAYCLRRTGNDRDAEDATAEAFSVAWRRRRDLPEAPLPWLYGVARRVLANQRRGGRRWAGLLDRLRHQPPERGDGRTTAGPALEALAALRNDDQEVLRLVAWEDLSHAEIATALGISTNAVAIRLHRARQRYARAYADLGGVALKGSEPRRTSHPAMGSSTSRRRHGDAR